MADDRSGRGAVLAAVLVMVSTLTGCAPGVGASGGAGLLSQQAVHHGADVIAGGQFAAHTTLVQQMRTTLRQARSIDDLPLLTRHQYAVRTTASRIERQLGQMPEDPATAMARLARQMRSAQTQLEEIERLQRAADRAVVDARRDARRISQDSTATADDHLPPSTVGRLRRELADKAYEQALELGCDAAWDGLTQSDQDAVSDAYDDGQVELTFARTVGGATAQAVVDDAYQQAVDAVGPGARTAVDWASYGWDVLGRARDLQENDRQALHEITASGHTTALIHYARICLRTPASAS